MNTFVKISRIAVVVIAIAIIGFRMSNAPIVAQEEIVNRAELDRQSPIALNPAGGSEIGLVYEAYLSPHQEGGEEENTPGIIPPVFRSTTPSVNRADRPSRGHSVIEFTKDLSKAYVYLAVEGVELDEINMLHLHCGRPGQLGPILVDFSMAGNVQEYLSDGVLRLEVTNADIEAVIAHEHSMGPISQFTSGCPIFWGQPDQVVTIAGMALVAQQGELYFNLHTTGQTYFGDIRGQFYPVAQ